MYEFSLTDSVNKLIQDMCRQAGWTKVRRVMVKAGGLRKVNPELMAFIFAAMAQGTPAEGAAFSVMIMPVTLVCFSCGKVSTCDEPEMICPLCGSSNVHVLSGNEFAIEALEVEINHD